MSANLKFKTTIKCNGCVNTITPVLEKLDCEWSVDLEHQDNILSVKNTDLKAEEIINALEGVGYHAELISQ